jgi:hypothetical protein
MQPAYDRVKNESWSVTRAARETDVPRVTLLDKLSGLHKTGRVGRPTALSSIEDRLLVDLLVLMGEYNYPISKRDLQNMIKTYLDRLDRKDTGFNDNRLSKKWLHGFLERHKDSIVIRKPTNIRKCHAAVSPDDIRAYFANLEHEIQGVPLSNIFNCDESCLRDDPSAKSVFFQRGVRYPEQGGHLLKHLKTLTLTPLNLNVFFCNCQSLIPVL